MDDSPDIAGLYDTLLKMTGYVPRVFTQREEVISALRGISLAPAVLITDLLGHRLETEVFMRCVRAHQPAIRILLVTGCPASCLDRLEPKPDGFLQKPFAIPVLLDAIDRLSGGDPLARPDATR